MSSSSLSETAGMPTGERLLKADERVQQALYPFLFAPKDAPFSKIPVGNLRELSLASYEVGYRAALAASRSEGQQDRERLEWLFDEEATFTHDKETGEKYYRLHFDTGWCMDFRGAIDAARTAVAQPETET